MIERDRDVMVGFIGRVVGIREACSDGKAGGAGFQLQDGSVEVGCKVLV